MNEGFRLYPPSASTEAGSFDALNLFLLAVTGTVALLVATLVIVFAIKYRRRHPNERPARLRDRTWLEVAWTVIPLGVFAIMFWWGARVYVAMATPPPNATELYVVGKQWMWKIQHPSGRREINELHVPKGRPIELIMATQDVIHSFYLPAFRVKRDVVPGQIQRMWFEATQAGEYHLFCAEYCGTNHSRMRGRVVVMEPADYEMWLSGSPTDEPPILSGARLYERFKCNTCHGIQAPTLAGVFGTRVRLEDGRTVTADENYLRESILDPRAKIVAGYPPLMPTYAGQVTEEQMMQLIAFIKSLAPGKPLPGRMIGPVPHQGWEIAPPTSGPAAQPEGGS